MKVEKLRSGMDSCPGGGAEIFHEPTRSFGTLKCDAAQMAHRSPAKIHEAGIKIKCDDALGTLKHTQDRVDHRLREQPETGRAVFNVSRSPSAPAGRRASPLPPPSALTL